MTDAPERIWAWTLKTDWQTAWDADDEEAPAHSIQYIRADLHAAALADRDALRARVKRLEAIELAAQQVRAIDEDEFEVIVGYAAYHNLRAALSSTQ